MSLLDRLKAQIAQDGPISVAEYFTRCLHDPRDGYYAIRPGLGAGGDFITAPLVSQMFGELIGLWAVETWIRMGRPAPFRLIEMGPGDGTLISDLLRAARLSPDFMAAADLWLVEVSPPLRALQAQRLTGAAPQWADRLDAVPGGAPMILVANEVLDCLPARQFVRTDTGWAERVIGLDQAGGLAFGLRGLNPPPRGGGVRAADGGGSQVPVGITSPSGPEPVLGRALRATRGGHLPLWGEDLMPGTVLESSPAQQALAAEIGHRVATDGGAALLIDYGHDTPGLGDTLQALQGHRKVDPLESPGQADLTVWADFPAVLEAARAAGARTGPILGQAAFLAGLGIEARAEALAAARPERADQIARQLDRLTGQAQMGQLFKVVCLSAPGLSPPLFEDAI
ncbi:class I SAM-dependent methyltransferase [Caulobacter sp. HMWF025]|uniref:class I SAM-dependent methyltransferase n=2 Tax=unclassified Caulobacter TaxID=2648921 RepID=UPI000D3AD92B|nr:class I SAM-dependent methyltransferase [Caulobacter sp. HMWF025]PTT06051.1 SAM-dependent methyltransferase [Caulobacter sp. HMWF025]